jgi:hypothetical protein
VADVQSGIFAAGKCCSIPLFLFGENGWVMENQKEKGKS